MYEKPELIDLNESAGHGDDNYDPCNNGSGVVGNCITGTVPGEGCKTGNAPRFV
ncbi:MAG: hypothetical protein WCP36_01970 [Methanomicrobiales archaeon]